MIYAESNFKDLIGLAAIRNDVREEILFTVSGSPIGNRVVSSKLKVTAGEKVIMEISLPSYAKSYREEDVAAVVAYMRPRLFSTAMNVCDQLSVDSLFASPDDRIFSHFRYN